jgi:hypothetical protein
MTATQMIGLNLLSVVAALFFSAWHLVRQSKLEQTDSGYGKEGRRLWFAWSFLAIITEWGLWLLL